MSELLKKARAFEAAEEKKIPKEMRPVFHLTPRVGWCNDPNGFSFFNGAYHLFYQYHPYSTEWGPMHWGHACSKDLLRWEYLPCALAPDEAYDAGGCFSGSAVEWNGRQYLMYTSVRLLPDGKGGETVRQTQSMAAGDGETYEKFTCNPVITAEQLPPGSSPEDFRDPKIWREDDAFYAVVGSRSEDGSGQIVLFTSQDLEHWEFVTVLDRSRNRLGRMWECPDFFELDGKRVLLTSPQEMEPEGMRFHKGNGTLCLIGAFDKEAKTFTRESAEPIDFGTDFYAAQTTQTPDGRRVMVAWMNSWENRTAPEDFPWAGFMTVPRELSVRDGKLFQTPVYELRKQYEVTYSFDGVRSLKPQALSGVQGRVFDMTLELDRTVCGRLEVQLAKDDRYVTRLLLDGENGLFSVDRSLSGAAYDDCPVRTVELPGRDRQQLRILMDKYTLEIFLGDGEKTVSSLIYTPLDAAEIAFQCDGPVDVVYHKIKEK